MKIYIKLLISLIFCLSSFSAFADEGITYFKKLSEFEGFDYSFVSPMMLKAMGNRYMADTADGLPIQADNLTMIESISTSRNGTNEDFWKAIKGVIKDKKLETLSTKKKNNYRYDVLAKLSRDGKFITNLLVITQNGGNNVSVVYMEGEIPLQNVQYSLN